MAGKDNKDTDSDGGISSNNVDPTESDQNTDVSEEYDFLDSKLDELNSALDFIEQKNDDIHEKLKELLQANRDIRLQIQSENNDSAMETTNP